eukprot:1004669-Amphidinium_carterae.1
MAGAEQWQSGFKLLRISRVAGETMQYILNGDFEAKPSRAALSVSLLRPPFVFDLFTLPTLLYCHNVTW